MIQKENVNHAPGTREDFVVAVGRAPRRSKRPAPISVRVTAEERKAIKKAANGQPLGRYIKARVFAQDENAQAAKVTSKVQDYAALGQALGMLGAMELAKSLKDLSEAAKVGALPFTPETEEELVNACAAVLAIKGELMRALGYKDSEAP